MTKKGESSKIKIQGKLVQVAYLFLKNVKLESEKNKYSRAKMLRPFEPIFNNIQESLQQKRVDYALEGKNGAILKDQHNQFQYDKEGQKKLDQDIKAIFEKEYTVEPFTFYDNEETRKLADRMIDANLEFLLPESIVSLYQ